MRRRSRFVLIFFLVFGLLGSQWAVSAHVCGMMNSASISSSLQLTVSTPQRWHESMNWYGPAGIGSTRAKRGFREYHGRLFLQGFPDRKAFDRDPHGPQEGPGHYIRIGDGRFAVTSGWPSLHATHSGGGWCGLGPSGRRVQMRVADWYRVSSDDYIIENWVLIDILHICHQVGLDVLSEMRYFADRTQLRWPD